MIQTTKVRDFIELALPQVTEIVCKTISFIMQRFGIILAAIALSGLSACGQYGPLYLPDRPAPSTKTDTEFDAQPAKSDNPRQP